MRRFENAWKATLQTLSVVTALVFAPGAIAALECEGTPAVLDDAEFLLLEVSLGQGGQIVLEETITAYRLGDDVWLPLGLLAQALEFPIEINPGVTGAEGWFLSAARRFELDLANCEVNVNGRRERIKDGRVQQMDDDIYVHRELLEYWFPLQLNVQYGQMRLVVNALEPLPVQQRAARRARWGNTGLRDDDEDETNRELLDVPYRFMDWPFVDATWQSQAQELENGERLSTDRYKIVAAGDFLLMNAQVSATGVDGELQDVFATLSRRDPNRDLLGPLNASEFSIGDIATARDPLIASNTLGRGLRVTNQPLNRATEFDRFNLRGELPLGWDVELYRNGQLIAYQSGDAGSRYDFLDIPLDFGVNNFRLVFYGPSGEIREETLQRVIGQGMIRPGEHQYRFTAIEERELNEFVEPQIPPLIPEDPLEPFNPVEPGERLHFAYDYGLTRALSFGASARRLPLDGIEQDYYGTHVNLALPYVFGRVEQARQVDGGDAQSVLLSTHLLGVDISAETARFDGFDSERLRAELVLGELLERNALRIGTRLPRFAGMGIALAAELRENVGSEGRRLEALNRVSMNTRFGTATHIYEKYRTEQDVQTIDQARQRFLFSTRRGRVSLRGEVVQELEPERFLQNAGIFSDWRLNERTTLSFGAAHLPQEDVNSYSAGINWRFRYFSLGFNFAATDEGDMHAGLLLSGSFIRDPGSRDWRLSSNASTQTGAIGANVYLDQNGNGAWDDDEPPVSNARVQIKGVAGDVEVNDKGYAFIPALPAYFETSVNVAADSLENPFWKAVPEAPGVIPRPGRTARVNLPVTPTGSIEGKVLVPPGVSTRLAEGQRVYLLTAEGEPVKTTISAYDGYYYFDGIPPGFYRIRMSNRGIGYRYDPDDLLVEIHGGVDAIESADLVLHVPGARSMESLAKRDDALATRQPPTTSRPLTTTSRAITPSRDDDFGYTVQLMAASTESAVRSYIHEHNLARDARYAQSSRNGAPWYQVFIGEYDNADAARAAIRRLPPPLQENGPYIRPRASITGELQRVAAPVDAIRTETWIRAQSGSRHTLQLIAQRSAEEARQFIREHGLEGSAAWFRTRRNGEDWYPVILGDFESASEAAAAARKLPANLRGIEPWVRRFDSVQQAIAPQ